MIEINKVEDFGKIDVVERAIMIAVSFHMGQKRKYNNKPYVTHPLRVGLLFSEHELATEESIAAAYLHDVIEDCHSHSEEMLREIFSGKVIDLVLELTSVKIPGLNRAKQKEVDRERLRNASEEAKIIKMIDRLDNLNEMPDCDFAAKYAQESLLLVDAIGDADYEMASQIKEKCQEILGVKSD